MTNFKLRTIEKFDFPLAENQKIINPEKVFVSFSKGFTIDFGALCFLNRGDSKYTPNAGRIVDLNSLCPLRSESISKLLNIILEKDYRKGQRKLTIYFHCWHFVSFINWSDSHGYHDVLQSKEITQRRYQSFIEDLKEKVDQEIIKMQSAYRCQHAVLKVLIDYYSDENFGRSINKISQRGQLILHTEVPDQTSQHQVLSWAQCVFHGFTDLVINQKHYPYPLQVPSYLNWPNNQIWVFGSPNFWWSSPLLRDRLKRKFWAYDYENGRIRTWQEILDYSDNAISKNRAVVSQRLASEKTNAANSDFYSNDRLARGAFAISAFINLFIANTGMNLSQALDLPWDDDLKTIVINPHTERKGFRAIKYRAGNRAVFFEVGSKFMPLLRKYVELRTYLLNGRESKFLFLSFGSNPTKSSPPAKFCGSNFTSFHKTLSKIVPNFPRIASKQWRAAKQDFAVINYDPQTASLVMQHALPTALKAYSNGSELNHNLELENYLSHIQKLVIDNSEVTLNETRMPLGSCSAPNSPNPALQNLDIKPNCDNPEGCLFCDKYRVSVDEEDLRKVLSARFCIRELSSSSTDSMDSKSYFEKVLFRIEAILSEVETRNSNLLKKVEIEVDQLGELDRFWNSKREMLIALDLV